MPSPEWPNGFTAAESDDLLPIQPKSGTKPPDLRVKVVYSFSWIVSLVFLCVPALILLYVFGYWESILRLWRFLPSPFGLCLTVFVIVPLLLWRLPIWKKCRISVRDGAKELLHFSITCDLDGDYMDACWFPNGEGFFLRAVGDVKTEILMFRLSGDLSGLQGKSFSLHGDTPFISDIPHVQGRMVISDSFRGKGLFNFRKNWKTWVQKAGLNAVIAKRDGLGPGRLYLTAQDHFPSDTVSGILSACGRLSVSGNRNPPAIEERPISEADWRRGLRFDRTVRAGWVLDGKEVERPLRLTEFHLPKPRPTRCERFFASLSADTAARASAPNYKVFLLTDLLDLDVSMVPGILTTPESC